jgi:diacylglycerol kinase family enzyme
MKTVLFHNPGAGGGLTRKDLVAAFKLAGLSTIYCSIKNGEVADALREPADFYAVAGGDGTVASVVRQMPDRDIPVAIFPLGSANNIARSVGIAGTPHELLESWRPDRWRRLDIGLACGPWGCLKFLEAVGLGGVAEAILKADVEIKKGPDSLRQGRAALRKVLKKASSLDADILIDGKALPDRIMAMELTNIAYGGPGLPFAPKADPGDGKLEVVCLKAARRKQILAWIEAPDAKRVPVAVLRGSKISFPWKDVALRIDDEVYEAPDEPQMVTVEMHGESARIMVPGAPRRQARTTAGGKRK